MKPIKGGILALASTTLAAPTSKPTCSSLSSVSLTFYGYPDNDPPSADIAWDCGRGYKAGGNGTYTNPLTTATAPGEFHECEILYLPYLQKYLIIEDTCASCIRDWAKEPREHHIDVWMESGRGDEEGRVLGCEEVLTPKRGVSVVREPGREYQVDDSPLWDGNCLTENTYAQALDVPGCEHIATNGPGDGTVRTTPTQESSATRTMAKPTTTRTSTSTSTSASSPENTEEVQQGSGFGMQARLGWVYVVLGIYFFCM